MEYYILTHEVGSEATGRFPQVIFKNPKNLEPNPCLIANMSGQGKFPPDDLLPFDYLEMNRGSKITDLMTSPLDSNGLIISKRLKQIFEEANVKDCRYYDIKLFDKKKEIKDYYYFHSTSVMKEYVDYSRSKFRVVNAVGAFKHIAPIVNSYEDLKEFQKTISFSDFIKAEQFRLKPQFPYSEHLFKIGVFNRDFFMTKKLKDVIEINNITGLKILQAKDIITIPNLS